MTVRGAATAISENWGNAPEVCPGPVVGSFTVS